MNSNDLKNQIASKLMVASLLAIPYYSLQATMFETNNNVTPMVFLPARDYDVYPPDKQQNNSLVLDSSKGENRFSVNVGWKLKDKIENSNEWRIELNAKF